MSSYLQTFALNICAAIGVLCFSFMSCSENKVVDNLNSTSATVTTEEGLTTQKNVAKRENIALYFSFSDSLDPYKATTAGNRAVCSLLFDLCVL